jgi:NAD-dependent SIR2 family protein deacetylase
MQGDTKNIIFLGAGASKSDGAPLQFELLRDYFLQPKDDSRREMDGELAQLFKVFYNIDTSQINQQTIFPSFEEVLGTLELALERREHFKVAGEVWDIYRIQRCREHVIFLICVILAKKLGAMPSGLFNFHWDLAERLPMDQTTAIISLNYDLLMDNAILGLNRSVYYGTEFANGASSPNEPVQIYKLHGSLNWLRCPVCGALTNTGPVKMASYPSERRPTCANSSCNGATIPIVVPPTFFKVMSDFHLQQVWHHANLALSQAERIFFCGYSLPDADMHIRYLLKRAEINSGNTPEVFVLNKPKTADGEALPKDEKVERDEAERYKRLFRDHSKVYYTDLAFQDLAHEGFAIIDRTKQARV